MTVQDLPVVNATLNAIATYFIVSGIIFIKRGNKQLHAFCMIHALIISTAFLTCYLIYHYSYPTTKFTHEGWPKIIYFIILFTHIPLAMLSLPMIILTVIPAIRRKFEKHKRFARWTYPIWLYVSVTGVLVYLMLYVWFPHDPLWKLR
jgi:putative membrane protein